MARMPLAVSLSRWLLVALWIGVAFVDRASAGETVEQALAKWEQASRGHVPPAIDELELRYGKTHSGHELMTAIGLLGPVRQDALIESFEWSLTASDDGARRLTGVPRDEVDLLFFTAVEVAIDKEGSAAELTFHDAHGDSRGQAIHWKSPLTAVESAPLLQPVRTAAVGDVQLAGFEEATGEDSDPNTPAAATNRVDDVDRLLEQWTQVGKNIRTLQTRVRRYQYDTVCQVEARGQGRLYFEAPAQGIYTIEPMPLTSRDQSTRVQTNGLPYDLVPPKSETMHWAQGRLTRIDLKRSEYERFSIPPQFLEDKVVQTVGSWDVIWTTLGSPRRQLPGLIETDAENLSQRFEWTILSRDEKQILLSGRTIEPEERRHYSALHVVLDARTLLTRATKSVDSTGTRETVHIFEEMRINEPRRLDSPSWAPNLTNLRELSGPPPAPPPVDETALQAIEEVELQTPGVTAGQPAATSQK